MEGERERGVSGEDVVPNLQGGGEREIGVSRREGKDGDSASRREMKEGRERDRGGWMYRLTVRECGSVLRAAISFSLLVTMFSL